MGRIKIILASMLLATGFALAWTQVTAAKSFHSGPNVALKQEQPINETVFAAGRTIDISSEVFGDVICAGQNVTISGVVHGDVICAGQNVRVTGHVTGDVRLAGQTVNIGSVVDGNATVGGQSFTLESTGKVAGDATVGSGDATLNGPVGRDLTFGSGSAVISSSVGRDITAQVETLKLSEGARVGGDVSYVSNNDLDKSAGVTIAGKVSRTTPTEKQGKPKRGAIFGFAVGWFIYLFLALTFVALALVLFFPRALLSVTDKAKPQPWKALVTGLVASMLVPVLLVLLCITVIGIPLAMMVGLAWVLLSMLSGPFFGFYLGRRMLGDDKRPVLIMLLGGSVLLTLYFIPLLGLIALLAAFWVGTGMLLLSISQSQKRAKKVIPKPATK